MSEILDDSFNIRPSKNHAFVLASGQMDVVAGQKWNSREAALVPIDHIHDSRVKSCNFAIERARCSDGRTDHSRVAADAI
ncbi:MAG TPA: hypothetical protein VKM55_15045 [Candidatus Lokiarchaeia archaeon]|nr:hypothetical protein [Candidatus Lokiarchaeia archaeon]